MKYHLIPVLFILFISTLFSQVPDATANFIKVDFQITTTPEFPGLCNGSVEVKCNEIYDRYIWKNEEYGIEITNTQDPENPNPNINKAILTAPGKWWLTVSGVSEGVFCTKSIDFYVFDMTTPTQISAYFENAGFYAIPIWREDIITARPGSSSSRNLCELQAISFKEGGNCAPFVENSVIAALDGFKPLKDFNSSSVFSTNGCLCFEGKDQLKSLETEFKNGEASLWAHQFFMPDEHNGFLFVKGRMPGDEILPNDTQKTHFNGPNNNGMNGYLLNKASVTEGFEHVKNILLNGVKKATYDSSSGIIGAHDELVFNKELIINGGRIELTSSSSTNINGVSIKKYKVLALNPQGNPIPGQYFANGTEFSKTVYSPSIYSDLDMKSIGYGGYKSAIENNSFGIPRIFTGSFSNLPVTGHYKEINNEKIISTWWIDAK